MVDGGADRAGTYPIKQPAPAPAPANTSTGKHAHPHVHPQTDWRDWRSPFGTARRAQTPATDDDMHTHMLHAQHALLRLSPPPFCPACLQRCKPPTQATTQALQSSPPSPASPVDAFTHAAAAALDPCLSLHCPLPTVHCPLPRDLGNPHHLIQQVPAPTYPRTHPRIHSPLHCRPVRSQGCGNPSFHTGTRSAAGRTPVTPVCTIAESAAARCRPDAASPPAHEKRCTCSRPLLRARACHDSTHSTNPTYSLLLRAPPASEPVAPRQSSLPTPTSASPSSIRHPLSAAYPLCCA
jgi:hypothetical protein